MMSCTPRRTKCLYSADEYDLIIEHNYNVNYVSQQF